MNRRHIILKKELKITDDAIYLLIKPLHSTKVLNVLSVGICINYKRT